MCSRSGMAYRMRLKLEFIVSTEGTSYPNLTNLMPLQRVLVGYDGTEHSVRALQFAVGVNDDYEIEIHLAFVVNEPAGMAGPIPAEVLNSLQKKGLDSPSNVEPLVRKQFHKPVTHLIGRL